MNPQKKFRSQEKFCDDILKNDFITDGGMKEREKKYYNSTTFNKAPSGKSIFKFIF
jgi:hypothetical protein